MHGVAAAVGPAVAAAVGPAVAAAIGPAVAAAVGPAVTAAVGPAVAAAMQPFVNTLARTHNRLSFLQVLFIITVIILCLILHNNNFRASMVLCMKYRMQLESRLGKDFLQQLLNLRFYFFQYNY